MVGHLPTSHCYAPCQRIILRIRSLANIDDRIVTALRAIRSKRWSYINGTSPDPNPVSLLSQDLGYPTQWGDPKLLPAYGGYSASAVWQALGVHRRGHVGGLPCEIVHGSVTGGSCTANVAIRGLHAFLEALALYLPVRLDLETRTTIRDHPSFRPISYLY